PVHPEADSGDGLNHRQRTASVCAGKPDSGRIRSAWWDAIVEICVESLSDAGGEYSTGRQVVRVPHRLPSVLAGNPAEAQPGRQLGRFRVLHPDIAPSP